MTIAFACDDCGKKYATPPEFAGKALKCKQCGTILRIPEASTPPPPVAPKAVVPKPAPPRPAAAPKPPAEDLYDLDDPAPIALSEADAIGSDDAIPVARPDRGPEELGEAAGPVDVRPDRGPSRRTRSGRRRGRPRGSAPRSPRRRDRRPRRRLPDPPDRPPGRQSVLERPFPGPRAGPAAARLPQPADGRRPGLPASLVDARRGFRTNLARRESTDEPVEAPPPDVFRVVKFASPVGPLSAYLSPDPGDGKKHPAIVWITGGDCATIGDVWSPASPNNDQSARAFREAGIVMMFPSLRGGNDNPGVHEGFLGEVDDVLAAARLPRQAGVRRPGPDLPRRPQHRRHARPPRRRQCPTASAPSSRSGRSTTSPATPPEFTPFRPLRPPRGRHPLADPLARLRPLARPT